MKVAFVPNGRWERAAKNSVIRIFVQFFADGHAVPSGGERIGQRWLRRAGSDYRKTRTKCDPTNRSNEFHIKTRPVENSANGERPLWVQAV
jgi:hypothetical protein